MDVFRLSWSDYETPDSLREEAFAVREHGWGYRRAESPGAPPEDLSDHDVLIVNSGCSVGASLLDRWEPGDLLVTLTNGYDHVDVEACAARGVTVARTPIARARRVVEHTLGFALALCRDFPVSSRSMEQGTWGRSGTFSRVRGLVRRTVGLVGYGVIGRLAADRFRRLTDSPVIVHDPDERETVETRDGLRYGSRSDLLEEADLLSLHADLNPSTRNFLDGEALDRLPPGALVLNTSRGELIDTPALLERLRNGRLGGAALDVFRSEPPSPARLNAMRTIDNLLVTPHAAGFGEGLLEDVRAELLETLEAHDRGESPPHPVCPEAGR